MKAEGGKTDDVVTNRNESDDVICSTDCTFRREPHHVTKTNPIQVFVVDRKGKERKSTNLNGKCISSLVTLRQLIDANKEMSDISSFNKMKFRNGTHVCEFADHKGTGGWCDHVLVAWEGEGCSLARVIFVFEDEIGNLMALVHAFRPFPHGGTDHKDSMLCSHCQHKCNEGNQPKTLNDHDEVDIFIDNAKHSNYINRLTCDERRQPSLQCKCTEHQTVDTISVILVDSDSPAHRP